MVRVIVDQPFADGKRYIEAAGLSTDSKPTDDIITGSVFVEADTGKAYLFNEVASTWVEVGA